MAVKHSTIHIPNDVVASADWNASHTIENNTIKTQHIDIDADLPFNNHKATGVKDPTLNQDAATKKYVDDNILLVLRPPIGSVLPWLKSYTNTPALPDGWVECNGQVLVDAESVYNGQTIPDLNGNNNFLRGAATSGGIGGASTINIAHAHTQPTHTHNVSDSGNTGYESSHDHSFSDTSSSGSGSTYFAVTAGGVRGFKDDGHTHNVSGTTGSGSSHRHSFSMSDTSSSDGDENTGSALSATQSILPPYYNVVWIMRVK